MSLCKQLHHPQDIINQVAILLELKHRLIFICFLLLQVSYGLLDLVMDAHEEYLARWEVLKVLPYTFLHIPIPSIHQLNREEY